LNEILGIGEQCCEPILLEKVLEGKLFQNCWSLVVTTPPLPHFLVHAPTLVAIQQQVHSIS